MSIYICTICKEQKDSDFNCGELKGHEGKEVCEQCCEDRQGYNLSRVLLSLNRCGLYDFAIKADGTFFEIRESAYETINSDLFNWDLNKETLEEQSEETQIAINQLLNEKLS